MVHFLFWLIINIMGFRKVIDGTYLTKGAQMLAGYPPPWSLNPSFKAKFNTTFAPKFSPKFSYTGSKRSYNQVSKGAYTGKLVPSLTHGKVKPGASVVTTIKESNGVVTDTEVVFVGIGMNYEFMCREIMKAVVYLIFKEASFTISNYDDIPFFGGRIVIDYFSSPVATALTSATINVLTTETYNQVATNIFNFFQGLPPGPMVKVKNFILEDTRNITPTRLAILYASGMNFNSVNYQTLLLQNTTEGDSATDDQTTSVHANPIYLKVYDANSNIVYQKSRGTPAAGAWTPWVHYNDTYPELFTKQATVVFPTSQTPSQTTDFFSNAKCKYNRILQPGEMRNVKLTHSFSGNFNMFWQKFTDIFSGYVTVSKMPGKQRIVAFDKMLKSGQAITVNYELNIKNNVKAYYKHKAEIVTQFE